jgi:hypothetical protein
MEDQEELFRRVWERSRQVGCLLQFKRVTAVKSWVWLPHSDFSFWVQRVSTSQPNICVNYFIALHIW